MLRKILLTFTLFAGFSCSLFGNEGLPLRSRASSGNFMGPTGRFEVSKDFCYGGVGGLIEVGFRQLRTNGTLGFALGPEKEMGSKLLSTT